MGVNSPLVKELSFIYLGYSGVIVNFTDYVIGIDVDDLITPEIQEKIKKIDLLIYSHDHGDHFHLETAMKIYDTYGSLIVAEERAYEKMNVYIPSSHLVRVNKAIKVKIRDLVLRCIPGKHDVPIILSFITKNNITIFHGAASDYVDLKKFSADVAFVPVGKPSSTCSPESALKMIIDLKPKYAIAIHGDDKEKEKLRDLVRSEKVDTEVIIPKIGEAIKLKFNST